MTLHILSLTLVTLHLVCEAYVLLQRAAADCSLVQRTDAMLHLLRVDHTVATSRHKHVPLLKGADRGRVFGNVWEMRQSGDMIQQAACLRVGGVAVGMAVFLLNVPPKLPALPLFQDFGLHLRRAQRVVRRRVVCVARCVNELTHLFVDKAVQDGHQETL